MRNCEIDIATHKQSGSKQSERLLNALKTDFVHLDERSIAQLIVSTNALSKYINFYDKNNVLVDNWDSFFQWETTAILAQISQMDVSTLVSDYVIKKRELLFIPDPADQEALILPFFEMLAETINDLWAKLERLPVDFEIKEYFQSTKDTLINLADAILNELNGSGDLLFTLQHHLFNKKVQNLFGLLKQWKTKSTDKLNENLESYPKHSPQYALYLTFLKLFGMAQDNLNEFTQRHLDFYYNKILNLYPAEAEADAVHLSIEPHKNETTFQIDKGTVFLAGKDSEGNKKYYTANADVAINQSKVAAIYGTAVSDDTYYVKDQLEFNKSGDSWKAFPTEIEYSDIGFALATPMLYLRGGNRKIDITFRKSGGAKVKVSPTNFDFYLSAESGWLKVAADFENSVTTLDLNSEVEAILPFNPEVHEGVLIDTRFPVLKIVPKNAKLNNPSFAKVTLNVNVTDCNQFKVFNQTGELDHTKSFEPYGPVPKNGHTLVFACKEFFQKKNAKGNLRITTDNETTGLDMISISRFTFLKNGVWPTSDFWDNSKAFPFTNQSLIPFDFSEDENISPEDAGGFAKFVLDNHNYKVNTYLEDFIAAAKGDTANDITSALIGSVVGKTGAKGKAIDQVAIVPSQPSIKLPYVPNITEMLFDYTVTTDFTTSDSDNELGFQLFNLYPKGYNTLKKTKLNLLPVIANEGALFVGVENLEGGNSLSLLFQVAEGTANPRQEAIDLKWQYLNGTEWKPFEVQDISDDTNGLTQSGIVKLNSPTDLKLDEQTEWPSNYWWIRIEAEARIDAICDLVGIHDQAFKATLTDVDDLGAGFVEHSDVGTVSKLQQTSNKVKKIDQPYISFGGKAKEDMEVFYQRTSERLRHKGRAISIWDCERLVLDNFPEVHQVKCLNHHRYDSKEIDNSSAGYVTLIPVAKANTLDVPNYWKPLVDLGTMKRIESFIKARTSPHVRLAVKAPKLEKLELQFNVKYREFPGADTSLFDQQLQDAINAFLSPWAFDDTLTANFQTEITKSSLMYLIEKQSYVDYLTDFKVNQLELDDTTDAIINRMNDVDQIVPKTVYSLFIPHSHKITKLETSCCS